MITLSFLLFHVNRISLCILQYAAAVAAADMLGDADDAAAVFRR